MAELFDLNAKIRCDTSEMVAALDVINRHGKANPAVWQLVNERFSSFEEMAQFEPLQSEGPFELSMIVRPSEALKSFMQDLTDV